MEIKENKTINNSIFLSLLTRDLLIYSRNKGSWINPLIFIFMAITLFALGIGPFFDLKINHSISIIWVICILSILLCLGTLFREDFNDGSLDQILLSPEPLYLAIVSKIMSFWIVSCLPVIICSPFLCLIMDLDSNIIPFLVIVLFLGTIILSIIGAISTSLTLILNNGSVLSSIISIPFFIPVIIFGSEFIIYASQGWNTLPTLMMLIGLAIASLCFAPFAVIAALKSSVDY